MQRMRNKVRSAAEMLPQDPTAIDDLIVDKLSCKTGDIVIKSGDTIVDDGELCYEFVAYVRNQKKIVVAVLLSDGNGDAEERFEKLFPQMKYDEAREPDRAFLIVTPTGHFTRGWVLQPTGKDSHRELGYYVTPDYLKWLLKAAK
jgi:hypothetical protein